MYKAVATEPPLLNNRDAVRPQTEAGGRTAPLQLGQESYYRQSLVATDRAFTSAACQA